LTVAPTRTATESEEPVTPDPSNESVTVERRRAIFRALVEAQDGGLSVAAARAEVGSRFEVTETQVKAIEREGLDQQWPPL
jgi:hypothetical protein